MSNINIVKESVVYMDVDCVVNAANCSLAGGGGVDGAIHDAAGDELYDACAKIGYCETGKAVITPGFNLKAKYIIHTVGPIYYNSDSNKCAELLESCYINCLNLAKENSIHSIAFPGISTGVYGYPLIDATRIALNTVKKWLNDYDYDIDITFCCFRKEEYDVYQELNKELS